MSLNFCFDWEHTVTETTMPSRGRKRHWGSKNSRYYRDTHQQNNNTAPQQPQTSSGRSSTDSDIPGYYRDEATGAYFKLQPDQMSSVGSFVTRENVKKQNAEKQRKIDTDAIEKKEKSCINVNIYPSSSSISHLPGLIHSLQCGQFTCGSLTTYAMRKQCSSIYPSGPNVKVKYAENGGRIEHIRHIVPSYDSNTLLCMWSLEEYIPENLQMIKLTRQKQKTMPDERNTSKDELSFCFVGNPVHPKIYKIGCFCWAPNTSLKHQALVVLSCPFNEKPCLATLVDLGDTDFYPGLSPGVNFSLGEKMVLSCAWNPSSDRISIGIPQGAQVIDRVRRNKWCFNTLKGDVLTQLFGRKEPFNLYSGTKQGNILCHDQRSGREPVQCWRQRGAVCHTVEHRDPSYLTAADQGGTICTWDKRMKKQVMTFSGLVNSYHNRPFYFDETETILTSTGSDSYTCLWDVRTGSLLRRLPPPQPASLEGFPCALYSQGQLVGEQRGGVLMMAMRNWFYLYS